MRGAATAAVTPRQAIAREKAQVSWDLDHPVCACRAGRKMLQA